MSAQELYATVTREQWDDYQNRFVPYENEILDSIDSQSEIESAVNTSQTYANQASNASRTATLQDAARYGPMSERASESLKRRLGLSKVVNNVDAANNTRTNANDRNRGLRASMIGVGRGISADAIAGFSQGAQAEAQRDANNANAESAASGQRMAAVGSVAAVGAAIIF